MACASRTTSPAAEAPRDGAIFLRHCLKTNRLLRRSKGLILNAIANIQERVAVDHERSPYYFDDEPSDTGGRFIADVYEMLVNAISRLAVPAAAPATVYSRNR